MFITTLNIPFIGVTERLLLFSLSGLACNVFNRHALPCVNHNAVWYGHDIRHFQNTDEIVINIKLLRFAFPHALRLMYNNLFYKIIHDSRGIGSTSMWEVVVAKGEHKVVDISNDKKADIIAYKKDAQTGQLLAGATIKATLLRSHTPPYEQNMTYTVTTDADGKAVFSNVIPGEYRIEVRP